MYMRIAAKWQGTKSMLNLTLKLDCPWFAFVLVCAWKHIYFLHWKLVQLLILIGFYTVWTQLLLLK